MKTNLTISIILLGGFISVIFCKSGTITGEVIQTNRIIQRTESIQFVNQGDPLLSLEVAPFVVQVNSQDHSLKITAPELGDPDSLYYHFIPGKNISIQAQAIVVWNKSTNLYSYDYTIYSNSESLLPAWCFELRNLIPQKMTSSPKEWNVANIPSREAFSWATYLGKDDLMPGDSLNGFEIQNPAPPIVVQFSVWGRENEIGRKYAGFSDHTIFRLSDVFSDIATENMDIEGYTVAPGIALDSIHHVSWFASIDNGIEQLLTNEYLEETTKNAILPVLEPLTNPLYSEYLDTSEKLEQEINEILTALEPYQSQMEPETWTFITENLNYVLRNLDKVKFSK